VLRASGRMLSPKLSSKLRPTRSCARRPLKLGRGSGLRVRPSTFFTSLFSIDSGSSIVMINSLFRHPDGTANAINWIYSYIVRASEFALRSFSFGRSYGPC
jgi:hypothetical protein